LAVLRRPLTHFGVPGWWGVGALLGLAQSWWGYKANVFNFVWLYSRYAVLIAVILSAWLTWRQATLAAFATSVLTVYVITLGFGLQYLLWIVPFAVYLNEWQKLNLFTSCALLYLVVNYYGLHMGSLLSLLEETARDVILRVISLPAWIVSILWLKGHLKSAVYQV